MSTTRVRVRDVEVRRLADLVSTACAETVFSKSEDASENALRTAFSLSTELQERIGEVLRKLDDYEDSIVNE